jgi:hypothetical protein
MSRQEREVGKRPPLASCLNSYTKYGLRMRAQQCLEKGAPMIRCPHCGNEADFALDAVTYEVAYVTQHHTDTDWFHPSDLELYDTKSVSGTEWDDESACRCLDCGYTKPLWRFTVVEAVIDASET